MEKDLDEIKELLLKKSFTKQQVSKITKEIFDHFKKELKAVQEYLSPLMLAEAPLVEVRYFDKGDFEAHIKFSGDTLVFMMHTNIFDFDPSHPIHHNPYIKEDEMRSFCGLIQIYNFLSDSIKYNREGDLGYLIGRVFINKEKHFFVDGKRPLSFQYHDISNSKINHETIHHIVKESMWFCLNFDLLVPPIDVVNFITVEQKNIMSFSSGMPVAKRLGFQMSKDGGKEEEN
ncbi:MAG: hypothetical protein ACHQK8_06210 [Bacteroidia bacterium]